MEEGAGRREVKEIATILNTKRSTVKARFATRRDIDIISKDAATIVRKL